MVSVEMSAGVAEVPAAEPLELPSAGPDRVGQDALLGAAPC